MRLMISDTPCNAISAKPTGSVTASYGTFGSATGAVDLSYGGANWGNFIEVDGLNTGRFLDPPEFVVFHDKGNELNVFDRVDRQLTTADSVHFNLNYSRSWFQTPNAYDNLNVQNVISGVDPDTGRKGLQLELTIEDPKVFTAPLTVLVTYRPLMADWQEDICADNPIEYYKDQYIGLPRADHLDF